MIPACRAGCSGSNPDRGVRVGIGIGAESCFAGQAVLMFVDGTREAYPDSDSAGQEGEAGSRPRLYQDESKEADRHSRHCKRRSASQEDPSCRLKPRGSSYRLSWPKFPSGCVPCTTAFPPGDLPLLLALHFSRIFLDLLCREFRVLDVQNDRVGVTMSQPAVRLEPRE